jgi:hypothetical protein
VGRYRGVGAALGLATMLAFLAVAADGRPLAPQEVTANLLQNPGAENGPAAGGEELVKPVSWETTSNFTAIRYTASGSPPSVGGNNYFAGGPGTALSTATQRVDVSAYATPIDAGTTKATLSAHLGGFAGQEDAATVRARFLGAAGTLGTEISIGPVPLAERMGQSLLLPKTGTSTVPAGTRTIEVVMTATRAAGIYNDGYFDNISLVLDTNQAPTAPPLPMSQANKATWTTEVEAGLVSSLAFCDVVPVPGLQAALADAAVRTCDDAVTNLISAGVVLVVDPPDSRYRQVAMPQPFPAPTVSNAVCRVVTGSAPCSRLKVALLGFGTAEGRVASITEATAVTANRASAAAAAGNKQGIALQSAAARTYWGAYAFALRDRSAAAKRLAREFQRAKVDVSFSPQQQAEGVTALGKLSGVRPRVIERFNAKGLSRDDVQRALAGAVQLIPPATRPVSLSSVLLRNVNTSALDRDYRAMTVDDVSAILESFRAQGVVSASTATTLRARLSRARNASRRRTEMRAFVDLVGQRLTKQPQSRFLQVAGASLAGMNIGLGAGTPAKVTKAQALASIRAILNRNAGRCRLRALSTSARSTSQGWQVTALVTIRGGTPRAATWNVVGKRVAAADPLAADINAGCP